MVDFAASNHINASTKVTLFFANYSFHLQTSIELSSIYKGEQKAKLLAINKIIKKQVKMIIFLQNQLA